MDLQKLSGNVNLDNIDQTLNWLEFNQSKNQIENELEELFNFIHSANRKIEADQEWIQNYFGQSHQRMTLSIYNQILIL